VDGSEDAKPSSVDSSLTTVLPPSGIGFTMKRQDYLSVVSDRPTAATGRTAIDGTCRGWVNPAKAENITTRRRIDRNSSGSGIPCTSSGAGVSSSGLSAGWM